jgi:hypothetical protein
MQSKCFTMLNFDRRGQLHLLTPNHKKLKKQIIRWNNVNEKEYGIYADHLDTEFLFQEVAEKISFTSNDKQNSHHFIPLKDGILHCYKDYLSRDVWLFYSEATLKESILFSIEFDKVDGLSEQMHEYVNNYLRD